MVCTRPSYPREGTWHRPHLQTPSVSPLTGKFNSLIKIPVLPEWLLSVQSSPNQGCSHTAFYGQEGFFFLLSLLLTQADWSLMGVPVFKRASSALIERMHMASFSSANRNLSSICWGLLDLPACVAERKGGGCGGLFLPEWTFWPWCRDLPSQLGLWSPRVDTLSQADLLQPKRFLWAQIFFHSPLCQHYGVSSLFWGHNIQHCSMSVKLLIFIVNFFK